MLKSILFSILVFLNTSLFAQKEKVPTDNPVRTRFGTEVATWANGLPWGKVVNIHDFKGNSWDDKFTKASAEIEKMGGGVIFFPEGVYEFKTTLKLPSRCIVRGEAPSLVANAYDGEYRLGTRFEFPKYEPKIGAGDNGKETAFKGIELKDQNKTTHCAVVNIDLNRGHIKFGADIYERQQFIDNFEEYGRNHVIFGCIVRNAAIADPGIPKDWQRPWQIWTHRHNAAIDIRANENVLIANNRIPESGGDDFLMPGYVIKPGKSNKGKSVTRDDITFRYDNRPGIYVNYGSIVRPPKVAPYCFAKGIEIRDNYVYCYGGMGIGFTGDGTYCGGNMIRFKPNNYLPIYNGVNMSHHVNNNRAIEMRAYRWTVEYNDYEVYSNTQPDPDDWFGHYGDGEGIMHEQHDNVEMIKDSKLRYNKGNRYLCIWRTPIDGLEIRGNVIRTSSFLNTINALMPSICVQGQVHQTDSLLEIRNVKIVDNITGGTGIRLLGLDKGGNEVKGNTHMGPGKGTYESNMPTVSPQGNQNYRNSEEITYK